MPAARVLKKKGGGNLNPPPHHFFVCFFPPPAPLPPRPLGSRLPLHSLPRPQGSLYMGDVVPRASSARLDTLAFALRLGRRRIPTSAEPAPFGAPGERSVRAALPPPPPPPPLPPPLRSAGAGCAELPLCGVAAPPSPSSSSKSSSAADGRRGGWRGVAPASLPPRLLPLPPPAERPALPSPGGLRAPAPSPSTKSFAGGGLRATPPPPPLAP